MKRCELCKLGAKIYCESDQASLCWDCDAKVHSANFLVARHSRSLLCRVCQSPTAWNASGAKLGSTVSVCESCVDGCEGVKENRGGEEEDQGGNDGEMYPEDDEYDDDDDDDDEDGDDQDYDEEELCGDDEDGDNQVVPRSSTPPPPAVSSSCSEESSNRFCDSDGAFSSKRFRDKAAVCSDDDDYGCSSSHRNNSFPSASDSEAAFVDSLKKPLKRQRTEANRSTAVQAGSRTAVIVGSGDNASADAVGICKLSENPGTFDSAESQ